IVSYRIPRCRIRNCLCKSSASSRLSCNVVGEKERKNSLNAAPNKPVARPFRPASPLVNQPKDQQTNSQLPHTQCAVIAFEGANCATGQGPKNRLLDVEQL